MMEYATTLIEIIKSPQCLLAIILFSIGTKFYFIAQLLPHGTRQSNHRVSWFLLLNTIIASLFSDIAWIFMLGNEFFSYRVAVFLVRIAWAFLIIQYQSLGLFIQSLTYQQFRLGILNKLCVLVSSLISGYFLYLAFFQANILSTKVEREIAMASSDCLEMNIMYSVVFYVLLLLVVPGLYVATKNISSGQLPKIVRKQLRMFLLFLVLPYLVIEFLQGFYFGSIDDNLFPIVTLSTLLLLFIVSYCLRRVMRLRFLNATNHVQIVPRINVIEELKTVLEQLSTTSNIHELARIAQTFFKEAFNIPLLNTSLVIRAPYTSHVQSPEAMVVEQKIEQYVSSCDSSIATLIYESPILIYDEIAFNDFYHRSEQTTATLDFLNAINADIFIPIRDKNKIIAYIILAKNTRPSHCYNLAEYDAMLVFASYIGNIINILQHKNIDLLEYKTKELHDEIYAKHQEINQYKESINACMRQRQQKLIGILFYKNNAFTFANQAAKELITVNPNTHEGHPLAKALKHVVQQINEYKTPYTHFTKNCLGHWIVLSGVPHAHQDSVIITVIYPDISDMIAKQMDELKDPNNWDYVLYLASTHAGTCINQVIPGSGPTLLNIKIDLLKAALSKKALLIDMPDEDIKATVEQLHHISLRETLHTIELSTFTKASDIAPKLFGSNPLTSNKDLPAPLLQSLDGTGTLFIKNIHFLDQETQRYLAEYITYGSYRIYGGDQKSQSTVRIICSTNQNVARLVQDGLFTDELFAALKPTTIVMPSLSQLTTQEFTSLIDGFTDQALKAHTLKSLLTLSDKEKTLIIQTHPASLQELKIKVQNALLKKARDAQLQSEVMFDPAYEVTDPELTLAARLGKQALKDQKIMSMLWHKFKNQNKIAVFLGVNRSSVYRRFKAYNIGEETMA